MTALEKEIYKNFDRMSTDISKMKAIGHISPNQNLTIEPKTISLEVNRNS